jgi:elongation factor P
MYSTSDFRKGLKIELDGQPYIMIDFLHVKPGKGGAFIRTRLKNILTGAVLNKTFRSGEKFAEAGIEEVKMQYLYQTEDEFYFMNNETYEQIGVPSDQVGDTKHFIKEGMTISVLFHKGAPVSVESPLFVEMAIKETAPGIKGDTVSGGTKPAVLETGYRLQVPLFLNEGDVIKIDTRTGEYIERVN